MHIRRGSMQTNSKLSIILLILFLTLLGLLSCNSLSSEDSANSAIGNMDTSNIAGNFRLLLTDATVDEITNMQVTFSKVSAMNGETHTVLLSTPKTLNLLSLQNGNSAVLADHQLSPGTYEKINFEISMVKLILANGTMKIITNDEPAILQVTLPKPVAIGTQANPIVVLIDLDATQSLNKSNIGAYTFQPAATTVAIAEIKGEEKTVVYTRNEETTLHTSSTTLREAPANTITGGHGLGNATSQYTLTYIAGDNGSLTGTTSQTIASGGSGSQVTAVANTGYHFSSWSDGVLTASRTDTGISASTTYTATFVGNSTQDTPTFSPAAGAIAFGSSVTIASSGANAIYYTTDGSTPATSITGSTSLYSGAITISSAITLKAIATRTSYYDSAVGSAAYTQSVATTPSAITLSTGTETPVGGVTNVAIPAAGATNTTGAVTGWITSTANKIKFTVADGGSAGSTITIGGLSYTSGSDYAITSTASLSIVVTTTETGKTTAERTFTVTVAAAANATAPGTITLAVGSTAPVGGVTNVAIPAAGGTDTTGAVTGWVTTTASKIKFTVTDAGSAGSTITISEAAYTSGNDYTITSTTSLSIVVTTTETGRTSVTRTFTVTVAAPSTTATITQGTGTAQYANQRMGQTFQVPNNSTLVSIRLTYALRGTFNGTVTLAVYDTPSRGTTLGTAPTVAVSGKNAEFQTTDSTFTFSGVNLTANTSYYFEMTVNNTNTIYLWQYYNATGTLYTGGLAYGGNGSGTATALGSSLYDCQFVITYSY